MEIRGVYSPSRAIGVVEVFDLGASLLQMLETLSPHISECISATRRSYAAQAWNFPAAGGLLMPI